MHANQTKELTETLLTIQTFRKMMKRRDYALEQREKKGQVEESKDTETQGKQEETESEGELMDQERENNQGNLQGEEHKNKKQSDKGRRSSLILDKVKQKAKWLRELIYGHGDVHRHPGPSKLSNGQTQGNNNKSGTDNDQTIQTDAEKKDQKICKICDRKKGKSICERCRELCYGEKKRNKQFDTPKKGKKYEKYVEEGQAEITHKNKKWKDWCVIDGDNIGNREPEAIRIGTWNIRKRAMEGYATGHVQSKIEMVLDYMKELDIQIMALQEVGEGEENKRALEFAVNRKEYTIYVNPNKNGLAIIVHEEVEKHRSRVNMDSEGSYIELLLRPTSARGYTNKASIALYNIHMETNEPLTEAEALPSRLQKAIQKQRDMQEKKDRRNRRLELCPSSDRPKE